MSGFKDMVARDNFGVFLNCDEFAEKRTVKYDGATYEDIPIVLSGLKEKDRRQLMSDHALRGVRHQRHCAVKRARLGDRVRLDNLDGTVEAIGLRSTRVRNLDGHLVTIPNRTVANAAITNISKRPNIKTVMNIGITYDTPPEKVQRALSILEDVYRGHPMTADVLLSFDKFTDSSLNLLVIHWWNSTVYKDYLAGLQAMNLAIKERFDAEKIEFAFPTRTIYVTPSR